MSCKHGNFRDLVADFFLLVGFRENERWAISHEMQQGIEYAFAASLAERHGLCARCRLGFMVAISYVNSGDFEAEWEEQRMWPAIERIENVIENHYANPPEERERRRHTKAR